MRKFPLWYPADRYTFGADTSARAAGDKTDGVVVTSTGGSAGWACWARAAVESVAKANPLARMVADRNMGRPFWPSSGAPVGIAATGCCWVGGGARARGRDAG